ncbi:TPA: LysM peptidoglycan-binding domain-containing protein [Legionella pneumophila]|nr:LysM peptidoglycan-binding domain-containing protein [Legionella pneumophila]MDW8880263.1 LysM peptidoglycan-binding domain-containing protein [Legionella pneumophila subsp. fraseri]MDW8963235.1 LysM peptidoglycan-binding domain-containing protein [Legionella pneumophila subsp. fraseri]MDW9036812.1 LysM peptidoglycan-binding domain-containing protein [Legionella pneumophila subsp. fraseri]MDW9040016.1 LysM peptidoglycan-binding domain-containing protein [Legionella pneumophila subsp. fraseri
MNCNLLIIKKFLFFILIFIGISSSAISGTTPDVWDVLRSEFTLSHEVTRPEVQEQIRWLISHPSYINKVSSQSEPYIYHVLGEIKKRKLPGELALLPMIESAYDPFAYSGAGAAGIWQLMPRTGSDLGLKQDWWFDGRRSIGPSTDAALNYLVYLNKYFSGNWILAIAAYDSGEGTISRAIKSTARNGRYVQFWSLPVPRETKVYVPRLLALAEIINNPKRYKITLPNIPYLPYFEEVNIGSQIDLNHAAKLAGISYKELIKLNPGYNRWTTAPYKPFKLLIPAEKVERFNLNLSNIPEDKRVSWTKHQVKRGDSLDAIAKRYHTTANLIKQLNQLTSNKVKPNQSLLIPSRKNSPAVAKIPPQEKKPAVKQPVPMKNIRIIHIVQNNDSYQKIQKTYGVAAKDIQNWNKLAINAPLRKGQRLVIWKRVKQPIEYIVKSGDSLSVIAKKHQTKVNTIISLNPGLKKSTFLRLGQKILIG